MTRPAEAAPPLPPLPADPNEFWRNLAYGIGGAFGSGQLPGLNPLSLATQATAPANRQALLDLPVVGGVARQAEAHQPGEGPFGDPGPFGITGTLGGIPKFVMPPLAAALAARATGEAGDVARAVPGAVAKAAEVQPPAEASGLRGFLSGEGGAVPMPQGPLGQRIAARAAEVNPSGVANEALAAARGAEVAPQTGGALKPGSSAAEVAAAKASEATSVAPNLTERQVSALRASGATDEEIDGFARTMAPPVGHPRPITSAEAQTIDPAKLTRSLQSAAGTEGVPLSQHPTFAEYGTEGQKGPKVAAAHGGDIGTATRAVMAGDKDAMDLFGPNLTKELIQNKVANIVRATGAPEEVVRIGLGVMVEREGVAAAEALPRDVVAAGVEAAPRVTPGADYSPLVGAMRAQGATDREIAEYIGARPVSGPRTPSEPAAVVARPGELFPDVKGPGQNRLVTQAEAAAANAQALAEGKTPPYPEPPSAGGVGAPPSAPPAEQPLFGPERMPGDVQKARQPMLRTGLAPHMTEPVVDGAGKVVTPARPVFVNGERVMQAELGPGFGAGDATLPHEPSAFPAEPIQAEFDPKTGEFSTSVKDAESLAEQLRIDFPKDAPPKTVAVGMADMISALFRNYIVSNALSPFTLAIKAGADVLKIADTTIEGGVQAARSGNPAAIPGSVKALYGGFWRGITQDALASFKNRQYALGAETAKTGVLDRMLSGELGMGAKRFAQAGEVLSLGSPIPRTISALTAVFQRAYRDMALYQEGYGLARRDGLSGALADQRAAQFMARPTEFIGGQAALDRATAEANTRTWTNSNPLARIDARNKPILGDVVFTLAPFTNLVTNIAREGLEFIPGAGLAAKGAEALMKGGEVTSAEWTRVVQHQFMGSAATLVLGQKAAVGEVTGNGPDDDNRRFAMIDQGWKPNHTKLGDNWYPNIAFGALAPLLNAVGNTHDNLVYNTPVAQRDSAIAAAGSALNGVIKGELDSAHWLNSLMDLQSAVQGTDADKQNFVARWLGLFTPQSGSLKEWERAQEPTTPRVPAHLNLESAIAARYWRQYPPALRPAELQNLPPGTPRPETGASAVVPYLGSHGDVANFDGAGRPEGDSEYGRNPFLLAAQSIGQRDPDWRRGGVIEAPSPTLGTGPEAIRLDPASAQAYINLVGQSRDRIVGAMVASTRYQNATVKQQETLFDQALTHADARAKSQFFAKGVIDATDPDVAQAQAVAGFKAQQNLKDQAYWVALLDRAGKLTPEITKAIDEQTRKEPLPGQKELITTAEFLRAAPLVHEFLAHAPYGTDAHPVGTAQDWIAVQAARTKESNRVDQLVRAQTRPSVAEQLAHNEVAKELSGVQRVIFLNGAALENPARRQLAQKYGTMLTRFLGPAPQYSQESDAAYQQFSR